MGSVDFAKKRRKVSESGTVMWGHKKSESRLEKRAKNFR
jgi:hypothetical protein